MSTPIHPLVKVAYAGGADAVLQAYDVSSERRQRLLTHFGKGLVKRAARTQRLAEALLTHAKTLPTAQA
jgi:hypothetical protein